METKLKDFQLIDFLIQHNELQDEVKVSPEMIRVGIVARHDSRDPCRYSASVPTDYSGSRHALESRFLKEIIEKTGREFFIDQGYIHFTRISKKEQV